MKILQVNKLYSPWVGGVEKAVQDISEGLNCKKSDLQTSDNMRRSDFKTFDMTVLCCQPRGGAVDERVNEVRVVRAGSLGMFWGMPLSFDFFVQFRRLAAESDIIHAHLPFPLAAIAFWLWRRELRSKPLVVTYHADIVRQRALNPFVAPFTNAMLRAASVIIVSSPRLAEHSPILKQFQNKIRVVPLGIDIAFHELTKEISQKAEEVRAKYRPPIVLFVGRLNYYKGIEYLISAMREIEATLLIVGEGARAFHLRKRVSSLGIARKVAFLGKVRDDELVALYRACDIFVLPSTHASEAFGFVQLEAMASGKPVVNTDLPTGVPWVSVHNETGLTVPPRDAKALAEAINTLIENSDLRKRLGENARKRVEGHFTLEKMLGGHREIYNKIIGNPSLNPNA